MDVGCFLILVHSPNFFTTEFNRRGFGLHLLRCKLSREVPGRMERGTCRVHFEKRTGGRVVGRLGRRLSERRHRQGDTRATRSPRLTSTVTTGRTTVTFRSRVYLWGSPHYTAEIIGQSRRGPGSRSKRGDVQKKTGTK